MFSSQFIKLLVCGSRIQKRHGAVMTLLYSLMSGFQLVTETSWKPLGEQEAVRWRDQPIWFLPSHVYGTMYMEPGKGPIRQDETGLSTRTPMCGLANTEIT